MRCTKIHVDRTHIMNKITRIFGMVMAILFLFAICSCSQHKAKSEPGTISFSNDMENASWINQFTLVKDVAHSGLLSSKTDSAHRYSFGYSDVFRNISDTLPKKVNVDVWVYFTQFNIKGSLVCSIDSKGKNVYWKGITLSDSVKNANLWKEIKADFELPDNLLPNDKISIYAWNDDIPAFYMDDLKVTFRTK